MNFDALVRPLEHLGAEAGGRSLVDDAHVTSSNPPVFHGGLDSGVEKIHGKVPVPHDSYRCVGAQNFLPPMIATVVQESSRTVGVSVAGRILGNELYTHTITGLVHHCKSTMAVVTIVQGRCSRTTMVTTADDRGRTVVAATDVNAKVHAASARSLTCPVLRFV